MAAAIPTDRSERKNRTIAAGILLALSAIMLAPPTYWLISGEPLAAYLDLVPGRLAPWPIWIAAFGLAVAYIMYAFSAVPLVRQQQAELSLFKLVAVPAAVGSGIMEEVVFRRLLMDWLLIQGSGAIVQIIVSAVIFGLAHLAWHAFSRERTFSIGAAVSTFAAGIGFATLYILGGRNLGPCIMAHFLINLVIEPWLVLAAVSGRSEAA